MQSSPGERPALPSYAESIQILEENGIDSAAVMQAAGEAGVDGAKAAQMLAAYARQGTRWPSRGSYAKFVHEADDIAAELGTAAVDRILSAALPAEMRTADMLAAHPAWLILIARFAATQTVDAVMECAKINVMLVQWACAVSPRWRFGWAVRQTEDGVGERLLHSPYPYCVPEDLAVDETGRGTLRGKDITFGEMAAAQVHVTPALLLRRTCQRGKVHIRGRSLTNMPSEIQSAVGAVMDYLRVLKKVLTNVLQNLYMGLTDPVAGWKFAQWAADPVLGAHLNGTVFEQDCTQFMLKAGRLRRADGRPHALTDGPVGIPHPVYMSKDELRAFRTMLSSRMKPPLSQLFEPVYGRDLLPALGRLLGAVSGLHTGSDCFWLDTERGTISIRGASQREPWAQWKSLVLPDGACETSLHIAGANSPVVNHVLYLLDCATADRRIAADDTTVIPRLLLSREMDAALQAASEAGAVQVTAALLEAKHATGRSRRDRKTPASDLAL